MTTTELIKMIKQNELGGATGRPREVSLCIDDEFIPEPSIVVDSTGDGMFSEICLRVVRKGINLNE